MYVAKLDRPWVETPFMFQGFLLKNASQIRELQKFCSFVYKDGERGTLDAQGDSRKVDISKLPPAPIPKPAVTYEVESEVEQEMEVAKNSHKVVTAAVRDFLDDVRTGKVPQFAAVEDTLTEMEESILRNPDAFMWLRRLKQKDTYTYSHCIDSSVLAIAFARQMGLPRTQI
jgi:HD-GYP domain-containing protein (c-di-GMP phosphodiesterase class II)